jgi:hypothetical protein
MAPTAYRFSPIRASAVILSVFATVGMMFASRSAGMDWAFTVLVGCCISFACIQNAKHKAKEEERERKVREAAELEKRRTRR